MSFFKCNFSLFITDHALSHLRLREDESGCYGRFVEEKALGVARSGAGCSGPWGNRLLEGYGRTDSEETGASESGGSGSVCQVGVAKAPVVFTSPTSYASPV